MHGFGVKLRKHLKRRIQKNNGYQRIHGDPEKWLREDPRDWAAGILFNKRTVERGILNPAFGGQSMIGICRAERFGQLAKLPP